MSRIKDTEFEHIMNDPSAAYPMPDDVLRDTRLSRDQKIAVLKPLLTPREGQSESVWISDK